MIGLLCVILVTQIGTMFLIHATDQNGNCDNAMSFTVMGVAINIGAIAHLCYCAWHHWYYFCNVC
jgi:hypothetical protein